MPPTTEDRLKRVTIGGAIVLNGPTALAESNPEWTEQFARQAMRIQAALGERALRIEHVGSTSVPGLAAKPVIDILLVVADSADEPCYVPALEEAGFVLRIREPEWHAHRLFKGPEINLNLHVFSRRAHWRSKGFSYCGTACAKTQPRGSFTSKPNESCEFRGR
jgi:GrpB-like predicted nucleotidyltransferase (UPF0157 family)